MSNGLDPMNAPTMVPSVTSTPNKDLSLPTQGIPINLNLPGLTAQLPMLLQSLGGLFSSMQPLAAMQNKRFTFPTVMGLSVSAPGTESNGGAAQSQNQPTSQTTEKATDEAITTEKSGEPDSDDVVDAEGEGVESASVEGDEPNAPASPTEPALQVVH